MHGLTWVRCFIDPEGNRSWVALRGGATGFDVVISLLRKSDVAPVTRIVAEKSGLATIAEATKGFEDCCKFYNDKGWRPDSTYQKMIEELLSK